MPGGNSKKGRSSFSEEKEAKRLLFWRLRQDKSNGRDRWSGGK
jgi:hypothetical protein